MTKISVIIGHRSRIDFVPPHPYSIRIGKIEPAEPIEYTIYALDGFEPFEEIEMLIRTVNDWDVS